MLGGCNPTSAKVFRDPPWSGVTSTWLVLLDAGGDALGARESKPAEEPCGVSKLGGDSLRRLLLVDAGSSWCCTTGRLPFEETPGNCGGIGKEAYGSSFGLSRAAVPPFSLCERTGRIYIMLCYVMYVMGRSNNRSFDFRHVQ